MRPGPDPVAVEAADGHRWELIATVPQAPRAALLWLPALGVPARHYQPLADALAARGVAVFLHEWRGIGSSSLRAGRHCDWGYREILTLDLPASLAALSRACAAPLRVAGGHSIGAQFAACFQGLHPGAFQQLWLVAGGSPYWRNFPAPRRYLFPLAFRFVHWLADHRGLVHGRRLGFAGNEARTLMQDWARVGLGNRYTARGLDVDLEAALAGVQVPVQAVLLAQDWFAPRGSMQALLDRMPAAPARLEVLDSHDLGVPANHFAWMRQPAAVVDRLLQGLAAERQPASP